MQNRYMIITRDDRTLSSLSRWTQEDKRTIKSDLFIIFLQMTREQKIAVIYQEMADKKLTLGCKVKFSKWIYSIIDRENVWFLDPYKGVDWDIHNTIVIEDGVNSRCYSIEEIIWRPVMIWDVIDWIEKKTFDINKQIPWFWFEEDEEISDGSKLLLIQDYYVDNIISYWDTKREPVEAQSDDCIDFIYSLIQN